MHRACIGFLQKQLNRITDKNDPFSDASEIFGVLQNTTEQIEKITQNIPCTNLIDHADQKIDFYENVMSKLKTHFYNLDQLTDGFGRGSLVVIGARSSMGKSAFAGNLLLQMSSAGKKILMINLEMSNQEMACRLIAMNSQKSIRSMQEAEFYSEFEKIKPFPILYMDNKRKMMHSDFSFILETIYSAIQKKKIDMVIVDYLQLIHIPKSNENRNLELENMTSKLKAVALQYQIPILCVSQLNRLVESRNDKRPMLSDLRDSGSIEQCADMVMLLYRDDYYHPEKNKGIAECIVAKNRHGNTGTVKFKFDRSIGRFDEMI